MSKNILVNNITSQDNMNLRFMSILSNDDIQVSITANGNPKKAVEVKNKIKEFLEKIFQLNKRVVANKQKVKNSLLLSKFLNDKKSRICCKSRKFTTFKYS